MKRKVNKVVKMKVLTFFFLFALLGVGSWALSLFQPSQPFIISFEHFFHHSWHIPIDPGEFLKAANPFQGKNGGQESGATVVEMAERAGYGCEVHSVETEDDYILTIHRIHRKNQTKENKSVVFIQHGLLNSAADWVLTSKSQSLAFQLVENGYDVWLGNFRGNIYSRLHKSLPTDSSQYWDFSWDHMARYDLPAMLDYTLNETKAQSLTYIGYSMGTTTLFALASMRPNYAKRTIKLAVLLAPVAAIPSMRSPLKYLFSPVSIFVSGFSLNEFLPPGNFLQVLVSQFCRRGSNPFCQLATASTMLLLSGPTWPHLNNSLIPDIASHTPAGTSSHTVLHFVQNYRSKGFHAFDGGVSYNLKMYGSREPMNYFVNASTFPTAVYWSDHDWLSTPEDVTQNVLPKLPNLVDLSVIPAKGFNHVDFLYAKNVSGLLYERIIKLVKSFQP